MILSNLPCLSLAVGLGGMGGAHSPSWLDALIFSGLILYVLYKRLVEFTIAPRLWCAVFAVCALLSTFAFSLQGRAQAFGAPLITLTLFLLIRFVYRGIMAGRESSE